MRLRWTAAVTAMLVVSACGGGSTPTASPAGTAAGASPPPAGTPVPGQAISGPQIQNAFTALGTLDSYTYTGSYFTGYTGVGAPVALVGTERQKPQYEIDTKTTTTNQTDTTQVKAQYIRIGNDIWVNSGNPDAFYHYDATNPANGAILAQYEPFGLALQIAKSAGAQLQYAPMGTETVNGVESTHYGLSQADRDNLIAASGLDPQSWAGDIWLATNGGWIVKGLFGPVMQGETDPTSGFIWDTTSINCTCPVTAPTNVVQ
jgi:hypothetical protein